MSPQKKIKINRKDNFSWMKLANKLVGDCLRSLPLDLRNAMRRCPVELIFSPKDLDDQDLLGVFIGPSYTEMNHSHEFPRIKIFVKNVCEESDGNKRVFKELIKTTLLHEIGHFLSLEEDELRQRGLD